MAILFFIIFVLVFLLVISIGSLNAVLTEDNPSKKPDSHCCDCKCDKDSK